jgi:uncharacterized Rmd1/YagE family protein
MTVSKNSYKVQSFQISDSIDVKSFRNFFSAELIYSDSDELMYQAGDSQYIYVFKYGVVCFFNIDDIKVSDFIKLITQYCKNYIGNNLREDYMVETNSDETKIGNNKIKLGTGDKEVFRIIMLNVSQSVALDYYSDQTALLLDETNQYTFSLEKTGRLSISGNKLQRFIGKTLNLMNKITENLYIFDSALSTWEDENLDKIDVELKKTFDLQSRYRSLHEELHIIKENLDLFKDIMQHKKSNSLEWIIIILILVELINLFFSQHFK